MSRSPSNDFAKKLLVVGHDDDVEVGPPPIFGMRYLFVVLSHLGLLCLYGMRINMSVAIVQLLDEYNWSPGDKGFVLSSFYIGYVLGQMPGGWIATQLGGKRVFLAGVLTASILTLLVPLATCTDFICVGPNNNLIRLQILRMLTGLVQSIAYPSFYVMSSQWVPAPERSRMMGIASSGNLMGTAVGFPLCSWLADAYGWEWVFYCFGALGITWALVWQLCMASSPAEHRCISRAELVYIEANRTVAKSNEPVVVPYRQLLKAFFTTPASIALFINHIGCNWGLYLLLNELPSFLKHIYEFDLTSSGMLEAMPYLTMVGVSACVGLLADRLTLKYSRTVARKVCQVIASAIPAIVFSGLGFVPRNMEMLAIALVVIAVGFSGFYGGGYVPNSLDICPRWSGILFSVSNTMSTIPGILAPIITGAVITSNPGTQAEYRIVFYITAALYVLNIVAFLTMASGEVVPALNIGAVKVKPTNETEEDQLIDPEDFS